MAMISLIFVISPMAQEKKEAEDLYTVKQGDTLWDISSKFLKDPFLWPKLWQRNPYITNPHWIYPGQPIRLSPLEDLKKAEEPPPQEEPKKVAVEEKPKEPVAEVEIKKVEPPPLEKVPEGVVEARPTEEKATESKPGFFLEARSGGFLSEVDLPGIGIVLESKEGKVLMAQEDIIYLALKTADPVMIGDKFTVVRASEIVRHPITGRRIGKKVQILGNVRIIDTNGNGNFYTGKVIEAFDAIERGDRIHPYMKERMADVEKR
jgi:LysM repeat protein